MTVTVRQEQQERARLEAKWAHLSAPLREAFVTEDLQRWREGQERKAAAEASRKNMEKVWGELAEQQQDSWLRQYQHEPTAMAAYARSCRDRAEGRAGSRPSTWGPLREVVW
jgi:hypothetical protein